MEICVHKRAGCIVLHPLVPQRLPVDQTTRSKYVHILFTNVPRREAAGLQR